MTLQLIVKGNASEARVACAYNGITVQSATAHPRFNETIIRADDKFEHDAQKLAEALLTAAELVAKEQRLGVMDITVNYLGAN